MELCLQPWKTQSVISSKNQWQFQNPYNKQTPKLSLIFEFDEAFTELFKVEDKAPFLKSQ